MIIAELRERLEESYKDFELLSLDWDKLDSLINSKGGTNLDLETIKLQLGNVKNLTEKLDAYKSKAQSDGVRLGKSEALLVEKEQQILELNKKIESFEQGS